MPNKPTLTLEEAKALLEARLNEGFSLDDGGPIIVIDSLTIHKPYGWVFFVNTKRFLETKERRFCLIGAGPTIVELNGKVTRFGTAYPKERYIEEFERTLERSADNTQRKT